MLSSCRTNPFFEEWNTPYGIPPYDKIKVGDYIPAIKEGIRRQQAAIDAITSSEEAPTFENTVAAYEYSGQLLSKVIGVLFNVAETDRSDALDAVVEKALPLLSEHGDNIAILGEYRHDNLRTRETATGDMAGELLDIRHHDGLTLFPGRATYTTTIADMHTRHRTLEGT